MPLRIRLTAIGKRLAIQFEAEVDTHRTNRRSIAQTDAGGRTQTREIEVAHPREDVARVDEGDGAQRLPDRDAHLAVEDEHGVAAIRQTVGVENLRHTQTI